MLIDRIRANPRAVFTPSGHGPSYMAKILPAVARDDGSIQIYRIDNVAAHIVGLEADARQDDVYAVIQAGMVSPLARACWFEFAMPNRDLFALLVVNIHDTQEPDGASLVPGSFSQIVTGQGDRWVMQVIHFCSDPDGTIGMSYAATRYAVGPGGKLGRHMWFDTTALAESFGAPSYEKLSQSGREHFDHFRHDAAIGLAVMLMATALANMPGMRVETTKAADFIQRSRIRRKLPPLSIFHVLDIGPVVAEQRPAPVVSTGEHNPLREHMVRAHFSRYSEDKPLFGRKGNPSLIWVPAHKRGDAERGVVKKDYRVLAPAGSFAAPTADGPEGR